ncbi:hypothetical protein A2397_06270 [Candidatus Amesbacteria bacterium RIFOXYB1_FULL_44_23]|uniref:histidine kinase n=1 Tax=Candidatus Amesbacteria bacterium RIFOXYB1_FULL_44_23 TaxID=1797263 RepID=A0A1F4ZU55_9BACT|nr:MAG: hypothetical protein A2397_06270 [Candidatus Amesbacteria bacterium RIFOXYB1_FULL_44_23]
MDLPSRISIGTKILLSFSLILAFFLCLLSIGFWYTRKVSTLTTQNVPLSTAMSQVQDLSSLLRQLEHRVDLMDYTGYEQDKADIIKDAKSLETLVSSINFSPKQFGPTISKEPLVKTISVLNANVKSLIDLKNSSQTSDVDKYNTTILSVYESIKATRDLTATLATNLLQSISRNVHESQKLLDQLILQYVAFFAITLTTTVLLTLYLSRSIVEPTHQLISAAKDFGAGNLDHAIHVNSRDEIGQLAKAFSQMAGKLKVSQDELASYNKKLESEVAKRSDELRLKVDELEHINQLMVGREMAMVKLKERIQELENSLGRQL